MSEIIELKPAAAINCEVSENTKFMDEARVLARLVLMPIMEYERARFGAAKDLGCRPITLDKIVEVGRQSIAGFGVSFPEESDFWGVGLPISFNDSSDRGVVVAVGMRNGDKRHHCLVLLANGNGTMKEGHKEKT